MIPDITKTLDYECLPFYSVLKPKLFHVFFILTGFLYAEIDAPPGSFRPPANASHLDGFTGYAPFCVDICAHLTKRIQDPAHFLCSCPVIGCRYVNTRAHEVLFH